MGKIVVVAERLERNERPHQPGSWMLLTPRGRGRSRRQEICGQGIFNLMGIKKPGTYTIECRVKRGRLSSSPRSSSETT